MAMRSRTAIGAAWWSMPTWTISTELPRSRAAHEMRVDDAERQRSRRASAATFNHAAIAPRSGHRHQSRPAASTSPNWSAESAISTPGPAEADRRPREHDPAEDERRAQQEQARRRRVPREPLEPEQRGALERLEREVARLHLAVDAEVADREQPARRDRRRAEEGESHVEREGRVGAAHGPRARTAPRASPGTLHAATTAVRR